MENTCIADSIAQDASYLSTEEISYFRNRLLSWRETTLLKTGRYGALMQQETSARLPDIIDQSVEDLSRDMNLMNVLRTRQLIEQINAALKRIDDGSFGYCLVSGEEIGVRRLQAWPVATLSVEVQEQQERHRKMHRVM